MHDNGDSWGKRVSYLIPRGWHGNPPLTMTISDGIEDPYTYCSNTINITTTTTTAVDYGLSPAYYWPFWLSNALPDFVTH